MSTDKAEILTEAELDSAAKWMPQQAYHDRCISTIRQMAGLLEAECSCYHTYFGLMKCEPCQRKQALLARYKGENQVNPIAQAMGLTMDDFREAWKDAPSLRVEAGPNCFDVMREENFTLRTQLAAKERECKELKRKLQESPSFQGEINHV